MRPVLAALVLVACGGEPAAEPGVAGSELPGTPWVVRDTVIAAMLEATGVAEPLQQAMLSTRLMGSVVSVSVREGEVVRAGQELARIDARDLEAKRVQAEAAIAEAEAMHRDALTQAGRFRALYADSAVTKSQLDQVETGLARAEAGLRAARAGAEELAATAAYAAIRAPFAGVVTKRLVDPGTFVAPGAPLLTVEDHSRLRIRATVPPEAARALRPGDTLEAAIEESPVHAVIEGIVPAGTGQLHMVNALVDNPKRIHPAGAAATLRIPTGKREAVLVPEAALVREGDLTGVRVRAGETWGLRWIRPGAADGGMVEVLTGLTDGETVLVPTPGGER
jgi:RND family efflux transporter MFP subunit